MRKKWAWSLPIIFVLLLLFTTNLEHAVTVLTGQLLVAAEKTFLYGERHAVTLPLSRGENEKKTEICSFDTGLEPHRSTVIFSEIAWMGSADDPHKEWIEIKNISHEETDISYWQVIDKDEQIHFYFSKDTRLAPQELLVIRRSEKEGEYAYTGNLRNTDEGLRIFSSSCELEDEVFASPSWPAGDSKERRTMERKSDLSWKTSLIQGGTPKKLQN